MPGCDSGAHARLPVFNNMSLQTNTPQKLHGDFTPRFLSAVTLRSTASFV
jgi:hypothetical protein